VYKCTRYLTTTTIETMTIANVTKHVFIRKRPRTSQHICMTQKLYSAATTNGFHVLRTRNTGSCCSKTVVSCTTKAYSIVQSMAERNAHIDVFGTNHDTLRYDTHRWCESG